MLTLNVKTFTLRVKSGDAYFWFGDVLTLNVKNGENIERNLTGKKVPTILYHVCIFRSDRVKMRSGLVKIGPREYPFYSKSMHR